MNLTSINLLLPLSFFDFIQFPHLPMIIGMVLMDPAPALASSQTFACNTVVKHRFEFLSWLKLLRKTMAVLHRELNAVHHWLV